MSKKNRCQSAISSIYTKIACTQTRVDFAAIITVVIRSGGFKNYFVPGGRHLCAGKKTSLWKKQNKQHKSQRVEKNAERKG